jgi:CheY-like chemotaxis protein
MPGALNVKNDNPGADNNPHATIFVVDDEPMVLDLAAMILDPLCFTVRTFSDPKKALEKFKEARPDLVVTDYAMGEMNGMDLTRECRRVYPRQKVLLVSGTVDESVYTNESVKPDQFLAKPFQISEFVEAVQMLTKG